jgi:putative membrane-bound dehydrogenase-like protein
MRCFFAALPVLLGGLAFAADLPPDADNQIPEGAARPVVVTAREAGWPAPEHLLPEGFRLEVAAASPLVRHPIMGCLDHRGRLFIGDAVGVNWNDKQLDANPVNRVLMLEDTDGDGVFDKSTIFADKMTFPQGACWHDGSLYVCSPPGLWRLTDTTGDGVADQRKMIVAGFKYTGNAADVHGPKLHPNGRLYWCHGRKGHTVRQKDGKLVHEGLASGIWSCRPDGSDVSWHSLGCADNPTGLDFTPEGDLVGTCNLYYSNPRGDTLMHWLHGGVYERPDQLKAIEGLPRTLDRMPVVYNFGHVAVSGCAFWRRHPDERGLHLMVTHFNTQRLVRKELLRRGASYEAVEHEFLKINDSDTHLTDVIEDPRDGSLLVLDTGGWFRIGCPSSLAAKPDVTGRVFRVRPPDGWARQENAARFASWSAGDWPEVLKALTSATDPHELRRAMEWVSENLPAGKAASQQVSAIGAALRGLLGAEIDDVAEHFLVSLARRFEAVGYHEVRDAATTEALRHALMCFRPDDAASMNLAMGVASDHLDSLNADLAREALKMVTAHPDADEWVTPRLKRWLEEGDLSAHQLEALKGYCLALSDQPLTRNLITAMLKHGSEGARQVALAAVAAHGGKPEAGWARAVERVLRDAPGMAVLEAARSLKSPALDKVLSGIAADETVSLTLRLKALEAMSALKLTDETFDLLVETAASAASPVAARILAVGMLARAPLAPEQAALLGRVIRAAGPVELKEIMPAIRKVKDAGVLSSLAEAVAASPVLVSQQESIYRTVFSHGDPALFETVIRPAYVAAEEGQQEKKLRLTPLAEEAVARGDASRGRELFAAGKGSCIACHKVGELGRDIGPNLSHIGSIRNARDLLESIIFPSATLARDYESHVFELRDGRNLLGVIRSHTAEGLTVADAAGQELMVPHKDVVARTTLAVSLMPAGLDETLTGQELLDLTAWLLSLR